MPTIETRAYRSKIGRLPFAIRNELCERLRDGATGAELCKWLNKHPAYKATKAAPLNDQNISDWRTTGYAAWLNSQSKAQHMRDMAETAQQIVVATGGDPSAVGARILAGKMLDMMEGADEETASELSKAISSLRKGENDSQKLALETQKTELARQSLALEKDKFKRTTCELFMKWHNNQKALDIADGPGTNDDKIKALLDYMDREEKIQ